MTSKALSHRANTTEGPVVVTTAAINRNGTNRFVALRFESGVDMSVLVTPADAAKIADNIAEAARQATLAPPLQRLNSKHNGRGAP